MILGNGFWQRKGEGGMGRRINPFPSEAWGGGRNGGGRVEEGCRSVPLVRDSLTPFCFMESIERHTAVPHCCSSRQRLSICVCISCLGSITGRIADLRVEFILQGSPKLVRLHSTKLFALQVFADVDHMKEQVITAAVSVRHISNLPKVLNEV